MSNLLTDVAKLLYPRHTKYAMGVYRFCLFYTPGILGMQWGYIGFVFSVCLCVCLSVCQSVNIYFVSKISQELFNIET